MKERVELAMERIRQIPEDRDVADPFHDFFCVVSHFILQTELLWKELKNGTRRKRTLAELQKEQEELYHDLLPGGYDRSWLNPGWAEAQCREKAGAEKGKGCGRLLSALYAEEYALLRLVHEDRSGDIAPLLELFLQSYGLFSRKTVPEPEELAKIFYWYAFDYLDVTVPERTEELLSPTADVMERLFHGFSPEDLRYLFFTGDYVTENMLKTAEFLNTLSKEKLLLAARTFTEGFAEGFRVMGRDLSKKKTVLIRYVRGFEPLVAVETALFRKQGLETILPGPAVRNVERVPGRSDRWLAQSPNRQFDYDHRFDAAIFWDKAFVDRKLTELRASYERKKQSAAVYAGAAVMEVFGETEFQPARREESFSLNEKQKKLLNRYMAEVSQITDEYMPGDETSFTIIAWPLPEIGAFFPALFEDILRINTLDNALYRALQQKIIDLLDRCACAEVRGASGNETSLRIALKTLENPERETRFENCVSDVNIPAGEVFTSPVLEGTEGLLHVSQVYIDGLLFRDLRIRFERGRTTELSCGNMEDPEEGRRFIIENLMGNHETLPMGEFAIGTNTLACAVAKRYGIQRQLPILIAEKTGPHFALGDTCYSHEEDTMTYNPDGKAIVARDNEISAKRRESPAAAYFGHHKDITLPYEEIAYLAAVMPDGSRTDIIRDGYFVLPGLERLNESLPGKHG